MFPGTLQNFVQKVLRKSVLEYLLVKEHRIVTKYGANHIFEP